MISRIEKVQEKNFKCYLSDEVKNILCINQNFPILNDPNLWIDQTKCYLNFENLSTNCIIFDHEQNLDFTKSNQNLKKYLVYITKTMKKNFHPALIESTLGNDLETFQTFIFKNLFYAGNFNPNPTSLSIELTFTIFFPFFERLLGNVIYSLNGGNMSKIPFLLRDLVNHPLLESAFTREIIHFIKLFFYTPKSLNLRNLCWHGFLNTHEYDSDYIYFLVCILNNICYCLGEKKIALKSRPKFNLESIKNFWLEKNILLFKFFSTECEINFIDIIENSKLIDKTRREKWKFIFSRKIDNFSLLNLILPELEHMLRKLYCLANNLSEYSSVLVAHTDVFYLTLDDLLTWKITSSDKKNFLLNFINEKTCAIMLDLFNFIDGPRLRDHLSHGELEVNVEDFYVNILFYVMIELASENQKTYSNWIRESYECNFHPIKVLKNEMLKLYGSKFFSKSEGVNFEFAEKLNFDRDFNLIFRYEMISLQNLKSNELQLISLIRNLIREIEKFQSKLSEKESFNENLKIGIHHLRKRQRASLQKFDNFKENFKIFFNFNLKIVSGIVRKYLFKNLDENTEFYLSEKFLEFIKLLKKNLKLFQNLSRFCEINKYVESNDLVCLDDSNNILYKINYFL